MKKQNTNFIFYSKPVWLDGISSLEVQKLRGADETVKERGRLTMRKALLGSFIKKRGKLKRWQFSDAIREKLYKHWVNDKAEVRIDDAKYLALREQKQAKFKKEYYVLLGLLERVYGKKRTLEIYKEILDPRTNTFDYLKLKSYFSKEAVGDKLGFYWGKRDVNWRVNLGTMEDMSYRWTSYSHYASKLTYGILGTELSKKEQEGSKGWTRGMNDLSSTYIEKMHPVWGWWKVNSNNENKTSITTDTKGNLLDELRKPENGDVFISPTRKFKLLDALKHVYWISELHLGRDMEMEIASLVRRLVKEANNYGMNNAKIQIHKYITTEAPQNVWFAFPQDKIGYMNRVYGRGVGNYKYRIAGNKLYFIAIKGAKFDPQYGIGGYIKIKNRSMGTWVGCNPTHTENFAQTIRTEILKPMSLDQVKKELQIAEARELAESLPAGKLGKAKALELTPGMCAGLLNKLHVKQSFKYSNREKKFYAPMEKELRIHIKKTYSSFSASRIDELTKARMGKLKLDFDQAVTDDKPLELAIQKNPKIRIKVDIDENDTIKVDFISDIAKKYATKKYEVKRKAEEKAKKIEKEEGILGKITSKIQGVFEKILEKTKLGKYAKVVSGFIAKAVVSFLDLGSIIKDWIGGKYKWLAGALGGGGVLAGLKLKGRRLTKTKFEKLTKGKSKHVFEHNYKVPSQIDLRGGSIVIADGKDFDPIEGMSIRVNGGAIQKAKKRKTYGFLGTILGGGGSDYKGKKIEIVKFIPKGFKIKKGSVWHK